MNFLEITGLCVILYVMFRFLLVLVNMVEDVKKEDRKNGFR
jgi:hypothetical protein